MFLGGAVGKLVCAWIGARIGVVATVWLTEGFTALGILALLPLPLEFALVLLPVIGVALNGTSSVLYGSVPLLVTPEERTRAFSVFYTGTIGSGAIAPIFMALSAMRSACRSRWCWYRGARAGDAAAGAGDQEQARGGIGRVWFTISEIRRGICRLIAPALSTLRQSRRLSGPNLTVRKCIGRIFATGSNRRAP